MEKIKLNLGSGNRPKDGYINIDRKDGKEAYPLDYEDGTVDEIRASHLLEHFGRLEALKVLKHWERKLKPGGLMKIAVPDFEKVIETYKNGNGERDLMSAYIMGGQNDEDDFHKNIFDRKSLTNMLDMVGLVDIKHWDSDINDCATNPISLNLQAVKPTGGKEVEDILAEFAAQKKNCYSQYGEDGITEAIFNRIGVKNGWCLEVGASDGILFSNTRQFVEQGWNAILIESEKLAYDRLVENCKDYPFAHPIHATIGPDCTIESVLKSFPECPKDLDLLVIDIDGQDYHAWNAMMEYKPRIMIAEFNPDAEFEYIPKIGSTKSGLDQAGKSAMTRLGMSKGYKGCIETGCNIVVLHEDNFATNDEEDAEPEKKPEAFDAPPEAYKQIGGKKEKPEVQRMSKNITAIMSAPRLGFTRNLMIAAKVLTPLGVNMEVGFGVYWSQILSRMMQKQIDEGVEWIVCLDYDSYYLKEHFLAMCQLMEQYPDVDAIMPVQMKREGNTMLAGVSDPDKIGVRFDANTDLIEVDSGHFGLTFLRTAAFKKLKKPWFLEVPNDDGEWGEGRVDSDIYFWNNWRKSGLKLCLTPQVLIGHMELMVTWPGKLAKDSVPFHQHVNEADEKGIPEWCEVAPEYIPKVIRD